MLDRSISRRSRWKVQGRPAVLEYAAQYGVRPAAAWFGLDRKTVRACRNRVCEAGVAGLVPRCPRRRRRIPVAVVELIAHARGVRLGRLSHSDLASARASGQGRSGDDYANLR